MFAPPRVPFGGVVGSLASCICFPVTLSFDVARDVA